MVQTLFNFYRASDDELNDDLDILVITTYADDAIDMVGKRLGIQYPEKIGMYLEFDVCTHDIRKTTNIIWDQKNGLEEYHGDSGNVEKAKLMVEVVANE